MRKFTKPFDDYVLDSVIKPITVELNPQLQSYKNLIDNPIYYFHAFQYKEGGMLRAIFGYEKIWDKKLEDQFTEKLEFFLKHQEDKKLYYIEEGRFLKKTTLAGIKWKRMIKPQINFHYRHTRQRLNDATIVPPGTKALFRVNLMDKPFHVDVELTHKPNGNEWYQTIITLRYHDYLRLKKGKMIETTDKGRDRKGSPTRKPSTSSSPQTTSREHAAKNKAVRLSSLRQ